MTKHLSNHSSWLKSTSPCAPKTRLWWHSTTALAVSFSCSWKRRGSRGKCSHLQRRSSTLQMFSWVWSTSTKKESCTRTWSPRTFLLVRMATPNWLTSVYPTSPLKPHLHPIVRRNASRHPLGPSFSAPSNICLLSSSRLSSSTSRVTFGPSAVFCMKWWLACLLSWTLPVTRWKLCKEFWVSIIVVTSLIYKLIISFFGVVLVLRHSSSNLCKFLLTFLSSY